MARGTQLRTLLADLRSEVGHSTAVNLGLATQEMMLTMLERTQRRLWSEWSWPFLQVSRDIRLATGQRYYDMPSDLILERVERAEIKDGGSWLLLYWGIGARHYTTHDSDLDARSWPPLRWDAYEGDQLEVWPLPSKGAAAQTEVEAGSFLTGTIYVIKTVGDTDFTAIGASANTAGVKFTATGAGSGSGTATEYEVGVQGVLRLRGVRNLTALTALDDTADLDDQLIVLYAAAELLARQKSGDAQLKLAQANAHFQRVKARLSKSETVVFGDTPRVQRERLYVAS